VIGRVEAFMLFVEALSFYSFILFPFLIRDTDHSTTEKDHEVVREEARDLMRQIQEKGVENDPDWKVRPPKPC
jgi:hypothetical protein